MSGDERREEILKLLKNSKEPISGRSLAQKFDVSRQVIVQDVALLRAKMHKITSTNTGYILAEKDAFTRVFKVSHSDEEAEEELKLIVDLGGCVEDVFVYHKAYGLLRADLNIKSRMDVEKFMSDIRSGKSSLLKNVTSGYHYHTVTASSEAILDVIQEKLSKKGFLASLTDYEPVEFKKAKDN